MGVNKMFVEVHEFASILKFCVTNSQVIQVLMIWRVTSSTTVTSSLPLILPFHSPYTLIQLPYFLI